MNGGERHTLADRLQAELAESDYVLRATGEKLEAIREQRDEALATVEGLGEKIRVLEVCCDSEAVRGNEAEALIEAAHEMVTRELVLARHGHREGPTGTPKYAAFLAALRVVLEGGNPPKPEPVEWP